MYDFSHSSDQELVNLICELRPRASTMPLNVDVPVQHIDWERLAAAEAAIIERGYSETSRGMWVKSDDEAVYLVERH